MSQSLVLPRRGEQAVVIGGGIAGLVAARVLADAFTQVTVLDADDFPDVVAPRRSIPHGHHSHVLMANGRLVFERFFPGLDADLEAAGVPLLDWAGDCLVFSSGGLVPRFPSRLLTRTCSRPQLELLVRRHVQRLPNVRLRTRAKVTGLTLAGSRVDGVRLEGEADPVRADFVVDASGRHSLAPKWLEALGYPAPAQSVVNSFLGYATRIYERPADAPTSWKGIVMNSVPPHNPRAAGLWPIENNQWLITLAGIDRSYPPTDEAAFREFAGQLQSPNIGQMIDRAKPVTPIHGFRRTENQWRHYERLERFPARFAVVGDGVAAFNPIYGQGMSVAGMQCEVLQTVLGSATSLDDVGRRYHRKIPSLILDAWVIATSEDSRWPSTEGASRNLLGRLTHWYVANLMAVSPHSARVVEAFLSVIHMLERPSALAHPLVLGRVLAHALNPFARPQRALPR